MEEDTITYQLYHVQNLFSDSVNSFVSSASCQESQVAACTSSQLLVKIHDLIQPWLSQYIWQKDPFHLQCLSTKSDSMAMSIINTTNSYNNIDPINTTNKVLNQKISSPPLPNSIFQFFGQTRFGDCVDDEWFIVWLLIQLTLAFPNLIIR